MASESLKGDRVGAGTPERRGGVVRLAKAWNQSRLFLQQVSSPVKFLPRDFVLEETPQIDGLNSECDLCARIGACRVLQSVRLS